MITYNCNSPICLSHVPITVLLLVSCTDQKPVTQFQQSSQKYFVEAPTQVMQCSELFDVLMLTVMSDDHGYDPGYLDLAGHQCKSCTQLH